MSAGSYKDADAFLVALGQALEPEDAAAQARERACRGLWLIAPLSSGRRGRPLPGRNYDADARERIELLVAGVAALADCVYDHAAVDALLRRDAALAQRSRRNLAAVLHPQNPLRPFDPLHTIGRALLPLPLMNMALEREAARRVLEAGFQIEWLGQGEARGAWGKAWFTGLLLSLYLGWKWHGAIGLSAAQPGWLAAQPLAGLGPGRDPDIRLPGMDEDLVTAGQEELSLAELTEDWTEWERREKIGVPGSQPQLRPLAWQCGALPPPVPAPAFETYAHWLFACLGLYRGANDARLHGDGLLDALLDPSAAVPAAHLHTAALPALLRSARLSERLPGAPADTELAGAWGEMMCELLRRHRRGIGENGLEQGGLALAAYPIEGWARAGGAVSPATLAAELGAGMPWFRELTSLLWMFFVDDPLRLRHPNERGGRGGANKNIQVE